MRFIITLSIGILLFTGVAIAQTPMIQNTPVQAPIELNNQQLTQAVVENFKSIQNVGFNLERMAFIVNQLALDPEFPMAEEFKSAFERASQVWDAKVEEMRKAAAEEQAKDKRIAELEAQLAAEKAKNEETSSKKKKKD